MIRWNERRAHPATDNPRASGPSINIALACCLLLLTVTPLERDDVHHLTQIDLLAAMKLGIRLLAIGVFSIQLVAFNKRRPLGAALACLLPALGYVGWATASTSWSALPAVTFGQVLGLSALWCLAAAVFVWRQDGDERRWFLAISVSLTLFSGGLLVAFFVNGAGSDRFAFRYAHPTTAGSTASLGVIIATFAALRGWRWANRMFIVSLATHGLILLIAWNRWSIALATTGSLACLTMYLRPQTRAALATAGAILCIAYLTVDAGWRGAEQVAAPVVKYGARGQTAGQLKDASGRRQLWETMWRSYSDSPWKGHGYFVTSSTGALDIWGRRTNFTAHNMFLQALVSTGLIGCALFSLAVAWTATRIGIATWAANANGSRELFAFYLLMGAWLLAWGILNAGLLGPLQPLSVVFAVGVGLAFGRLAWDREQQLIALEAAQ